MIDFTFNGALEWDIVPQSLGTDLWALELETRLKAEADVQPQLKHLVSEFTVFLSTTRGLTVRKKASPPVTHLAMLINNHDMMTSLEVWTAYLNTPNPLLDAWKAAWQHNQVLFPVDPAQLPTEALTDEQRDALKDPASPLA